MDRQTECDAYLPIMQYIPFCSINKLANVWKLEQVRYLQYCFNVRTLSMVPATLPLRMCDVSTLHIWCHHFACMTSPLGTYDITTWHLWRHHLACMTSPLGMYDVTTLNGVESYFSHVVVKFYLLIWHLQKKYIIILKFVSCLVTYAPKCH